jgi:hypothetical protein
MSAHAVSWLGTRTPHVDAMRSLYRALLEVEPTVDTADLVVFDLPGGDTVELFSPEEPDHLHFTTGPVAGFLVDELQATTGRLVAEGAELLGPPARDEASGVSWAHFRAPDGNIYELTVNPSHPAGRPRPALPPLAGEDHVCAGCGIAYASVTVEQAAAAIASQPRRFRARCHDVPDHLLRRSPDPDTWSALEYLCHVRDVYATSMTRLYRTGTEHHPCLEPMLNDLRAARLGYNNRDPSAVLDELDDNADGLGQEIGRVSTDGWERRASRLPGETRSARWLVRNAMHEGVHHLRDIEDVLRRPGSPGVPP